MQSRHLVIFTRYPRMGAGKRRLAAGVGPVEAVRFQRVSLANTLRRIGHDRRWTTWLAVTPDRSGPWPPACKVVPQGSGDLGKRLSRVIHRLPRGPMLIIGSDAPYVTAELIGRGFQLLEGHDAVFGPAMDGGYWAIGLRRRPRIIAPFDAVRWSTEYALSDTLRNLDGCSAAMLPQLDDVDDVASLARCPHWSILHGPYLR